MAREHHNRLINEIVDRTIRELAPSASGRLLDIGCGAKPYEADFAPYVDEYVGLEHADATHGTDHADLIGSAYEIPARDCSFDTVLSTAVLEHLEEPAGALREARRVLRPGGLAIYIAPFIWHLHEEPRDFYRYSRYGLEHLFRGAGFDVAEIRPLSGFWVTFGQLFVYYLRRFDRGPGRPVVPAVSGAVQRVSGFLDRLDRAEEWTWAYLVLARAPRAAEPRP